MSILEQEIKKNMKGPVKKGEGLVSASFIFPKDFAGFKGHFPGNPILPGVCKIQSIMVLLREYFRTGVELKEIVSSKFVAPVSFNEEIVFDCAIKDNSGGRMIVKVRVERQNTKVADIKLDVCMDKKQGES